MERLTTKENVQQMLAHLEEIYQEHGITEEERDIIWVTMAAFCAHQLQQRQGLFYDAVKDLLKLEATTD